MELRMATSLLITRLLPQAYPVRKLGQIRTLAICQRIHAALLISPDSTLKDDRILSCQKSSTRTFRLNEPRNLSGKTIEKGEECKEKGNKTQLTLKTSCWNCSAEVSIAVSDFPGTCPKCGKLQKYTEEQIPDYFALLGQERASFVVDSESLSSNMKRLQRKLHPDLFSNKGGTEQEISQKLSSLVNHAIVVLQDPIQRGLYMLHLRGVSLDLEKQQTLDPAFLGEVMELNEELEEISSVQQWKEFRSRNNTELGILEKKLGTALEKNDLRLAQTILFKMKYYENLQQKLKDLQGKFNVVD